MPQGTITAYDPARGSGTIELENGDVVHFDSSVATTSELKVGQRAEVVTGLRLDGHLKARLVLVEQEQAAPRPFATGLAELQALGLSIDHAQARAWAGEATELDAALAGRLCLQWYGLGPTERARADRVLILDEHLGDSAKIPVELLASLAPRPLQERLVAAAQGLHPFSLGSVLHAFNGVLDGAAESPLHYFLVDLDGDRSVMVLLRDEAFGRVCHATALRLVT